MLVAYNYKKKPVETSFVQFHFANNPLAFKVTLTPFDILHLKPS